MDQKFPFGHFLNLKKNKEANTEKPSSADPSIDQTEKKDALNKNDKASKNSKIEKGEKKGLKKNNNSPIKDGDLPIELGGNNKTIESFPQEQKQGFEQQELEIINKEILASLREIMPLDRFDAYFKDNLKLLTILPKRVEFKVPTNFIKTMIENSYLGQIVQSIEKVLGKIYEVSISTSPSVNDHFNPSKIKRNESRFKKKSELLENGIKSITSPSAKDARFTIDLIPSKDDLRNQIDSTVIQHMSEISFGNFIDYRKTFDNFVVGSSNNIAYASAIAVTKTPGKVYPSLYLYGSSGLGKTHLLHAMANNIRDVHPYLKICMTSARDFMTEMVDAMADKKINEFRKKYSEKVDVLMIDDIHELKNKIGTQNEFFHVFNELHDKGKQLIFTSDKPPKEIDGLEERIKTRLSWGLVLDIQRPDMETRTAILKKKAMTEDIFLPDDVVNLMATSIKGNIRELEGSLIRLAAYASVMQVDIDLEIAKEQLKLSQKRNITPQEKKLASLETVTKAISAHFNIPVPDICSKVRSKEVTKARHLAMFLSQRISQGTLSQIGEYFGNRDHSSVIHAIEKVRKQMQKDSQFNILVSEIEQKIVQNS